MDQNSVFMSYPNQKHIQVFKAACDKYNRFARINIEALYAAMRNLKPTAFKLWVYFAENQNKFGFYLSGEHATIRCGISRSSYHEAFHELIEKKYLIPDDYRKNYYAFHEIAQG